MKGTLLSPPEHRDRKNHYLKHIITKEEDGEEVLHLLYHIWNLTTKKIRSVKYEEEGILLDGSRVTVRARVQEGQLLEVLLNDSGLKEDRILPNPALIDIVRKGILYEDEDVIFVNKPGGIVSHPSKGHLTDSLANGVKAYFASNKENSYVHLIGRLDKDTSGILGIAKNGVAADRMTAFRKEGLLKKEYLAFVEGYPKEKEGEINISMEEYRDAMDGGKIKMRRSFGGSQEKYASTRYQILKNYGDYSLINVAIETGRTHQIRFHMAEAGHPLLGDSVYGNGEYHYKDGILTRTALHAYRVVWKHPFREERLTLEAPLPEDLRKLQGSFFF